MYNILIYVLENRQDKIEYSSEPTKTKKALFISIANKDYSLLLLNFF